MLIFPLVGTRFCRYALVDICLGCVLYPCGRYCSTRILEGTLLTSRLGCLSSTQVSLMQSRSDKTVIVRNQIAKYLVSLLLCNIIQAVGGLLNIAWLVEKSIYVGMTCTAQAALKQIGNVREPSSLSRRVRVLTLLMVPDWSSDFHFCNRRPNLLLTLFFLEVVGSHLPYHPHRLMGFPLIRLVHRKFCHRQTRERTTLWNQS